MSRVLAVLRTWFDGFIVALVEIAEDDCPQACRGREACGWCGTDVVEDDAVVGGEAKP